MMAWISPSLTVRSTPLRMCLVPWSVSIDTLRSRISRVDMCRRLSDLEPCARVDVHVAVDDLDGEEGNRLEGRQVEGLAGGQRELRPVGPALETVVFDEAFGERDVAVRAGVADRVHIARRVAHDRDRYAVEHDAPRGRGRELLDGAHLLCGHRAAASSFS